MVGSAMAQGSDGLFVIKKKGEDHYLAHVKVGGTWELQDATTFSPNCLWYSGREFNLAGTKHNYYFIDEDDNSFHFLQASFGSNGTLGLTDDVPETFLLNNSDTLYYFYDWDRDNWQTKDGGGVARGRQYFVDHDHCTHQWEYDECWEVYYAEVKYNDTENTYYWEMSGNESYGITANSGRFRSIETESFNQVIHSETNGINNLSTPSEMVWGGTPSTLSVTIAAGDYSYNYTPTYTTYEFTEVNGTITYPTQIQPADLIHFKFYYCEGVTSTTTPSVVNSSAYPSNSCTYQWEITGDPSHLLSFNSDNGVYTTDVDSPTLYYRQQNTQGDQSVTLKLTVTYSDGISQTTQTRTAQVLVKTPCQSPAQAETPALTYDDVTVSWYPTATDYNVYWKKASDNWASASSAMSVGDVTSYTITGLEANTAYDYKVCALCSGVEQPAVAEYSFTTKDAPDGMIYGSIFGGGRMANVGGKTEVVIINCDSIGAVYGGNDIFGTVSGADGSTVILGVEDTHPDAVTYNNGTASEKVRVHDVYGGGNGYYLYSGNSFTGATTASINVAAGYTVKSLSSTGEWNIPVWTNESTSAISKTIPSITKTAITVTNDVVKVDSIFGGAKNAFLTASSGDDVHIAIHGGTINSVFGGNNYGGTLATTERIQVTSTTTETTNYHTKQLGRDFGIGHLFGGGNKVPGKNVVIEITGGQCDTVFAGGNAADVLSTQLTLNCAIGSTDNGAVFSDAITSVSSGTVSIDDTYSWNGTGIYNVRALFGGNNKADMAGLPTLNLTSGGIGTVYGGGNQGNMKAKVSDGTNGPIATAFGAPMVSGTAQPIYYGTHVVMNSPTILADYLYGGCQMSSVDYSTWVEVKNGHVGHVFGGCNISGDVGSTQRLSGTSSPSEAYQLVKGATYVKASGGFIYENLFAGSNGYYHCNDGVNYIDGVITNNIGDFIGTPIPTHNETHVMVCDDKTVSPTTSPLIKGNVYAGGNMACVGFIGETAGAGQPTFVGYASVRMSGGEVTGNVFGGGNMASIYGSNEVQVSGGKIGGALYGGNDQCGLVAQITNRVLPEGYDMASDGHTSLTALGVHTYVSLTGRPDINTVYGGGNGAYNYTSANYCNPNDKPVQSNSFVDINIDGFLGEGGLQGGHIDTVYGGGNGVTVTGSITVFLNVKGENSSTEPEAYDHVGVIFGGNNMGDLTNLPDIILLHGQVNTIYGGCNKGAMTGNHNITLGGDTYNNISSRVHLRNAYTAHDGTTTTPIPAVVSGSVYGGCCSNTASAIPNNTLVLMEGGEYPKVDLFGGCDISGNINGTSRVVLKNGTVGHIYGGGDGDYDYTTSTSPYYGLTAPNSAHSQVDILGGTVDTCIYGGGKLATVSGTSTVNMSGGELGWYRTAAEISAHPTWHYLYGGGKGEAGDPVKGSVQTAIVNLSGGTVWGSIFGGGQEGPVLGNATTNFTGGTIGSTGLSSADGNIFGGGRGFLATAVTDGRVGGNVTVNMSGGTMLGSIFGGGRLGSVGMNADGTMVDASSTTGGHTYVNVTGGTIGYEITDPDILANPEAYGAQYVGNVFGSSKGHKDHLEDASSKKFAMVNNTHVNISTDVAATHIYGSVFGGGEIGGVYNDATSVIRGSAVVDGNAFAAGKGVMHDDNMTYQHVGDVGHNANFTLQGNAWVKTCVYGGAEVANVIGDSYVNIEGGNVGVERDFATIDAATNCVGLVFGGGKGDPAPGSYNLWTNVQNSHVTFTPNSPIRIYGSVFGGGEDGHILGDTDVDITLGSNDSIGTFGYTKKEGNVYGAGRGYNPAAPTAGGTGGNTKVTIKGSGTILGSVYGGGRIASTGVFFSDDNSLVHPLDDNGSELHGHTEVTISGCTIGHDKAVQGSTTYLVGDVGGNVFGGPMGQLEGSTSTQTTLIYSMQYVNYSKVTINGSAIIKGSVYGGGEFGFVRNDAEVHIDGGTIGIDRNEPESELTYSGSVYGGSWGDPRIAYVDLGRIWGNTDVTVTGGLINNCVFGGGANANVGDALKPSTTGKATVTMSGGTLGWYRTVDEVKARPRIHYLYGGGQGMAGNTTAGSVSSTEVTLSGGTVWGSIFGGGQEGPVVNDVELTFSGGHLGSTGASGADGNIFGGGRGFEGTAVTDGRVGGNVTVTVEGNGLMRGSIYGGGRLGSVGMDANGDMLAGNDHGYTTITVNGTVHIEPEDLSVTQGGNIYGACKGLASEPGTTISNMAKVKETRVTVGGVTGDNVVISGSVFGGGEDGRVVNVTTAKATEGGDTHVFIKDGTTIGIAGGVNDFNGNVYGGGRGTGTYEDPTTHEQVFSNQSGRVAGNTHVNIVGGTVYQYVFGGGNRSVVEGRKIVNFVGGFVHKDVYGGSRFIPQEDGWQQPGLKTVNMLGGKVHNVFGCGQNTIEGNYTLDGSGNPAAVSDDPTAFVNMSGGYLYNNSGDLGSAHAAGMAGTVYGSVVLNIGASAINDAPYNSFNIDKNDVITELPDLYQGVTVAHVPAKLQVSGSVYGGSNFFKMNDFQTNWQRTNITGYSNIYIDGKDYDMSAVANDYEDWAANATYMVIDGNFFGCGTHCESGAKGRDITVRNYGNRNTDANGWFTGSTRPMGTVQRCNNLVIDNSNFTFTGAPAIDGNTGRTFAVYKVDDCFYVANGSAVTLGSDNVSADMDSIKLLRSVHLKTGDLYDATAPSTLDWEWIGIREKSHVANRLFYSSGDETQSGTENMLPFPAENVMIFNREAKLYVRYNNHGNTVYSELNGFFRMIAESYTPWSINSFAYARPKLTVHNEGVASGQPSVNGGDGGFMSYDKKFNFYIMTNLYDGDDGGDPHTRTNQYPYTNVEGNSKGYIYRQWIVDNFHGRRWYVAGTGTLGYDSDPNNSTAYDDYGLYPDKPKKSLSGTNGVFAGTWSTNNSGKLEFSFDDDIVTYGANPPTGHVTGEINYDASTFHDVVYVVEPVLASNENGTIQPPVSCTERIHLYRYPGDPVPPSGPISYNQDPGANYQEMIIVDDNLTLKDVLVDGFYGHVGIDPTYLDIPTSFHVEDVEKPLVVTDASQTLTLTGGTILKRGYNKNNADYYSNVDYSVTTIPQGGALLLDNAATLNVEGSVYILDNWQYLTGSADPIRSNVYLPTFAKFLNITSNGLNADARIGITSPQRNAADNYKDNTFSPIAKATDATKAHTAWQQNNFLDDLDIFFGSGTNEQFGDHTTYYSSENVMNGSNQILDNTKLYFGWTWNNIVRSEPLAGYSVSGDNITISNTNGLAWLISVVNGLNGVTGGANNLSGKTITLTDDVDLSQYVWVPVGNEKTGYEKFAGAFDGKGHLIKGMSIAYIGVGDGRYMLNNYGMFGKTNGAKIKRTFLVGSSIAPNSKGNLGGLIGVMEGSGSLIEHSEAQVEITTHTDQANNNACGGLVGILTDGEIRSSMALPTINCPIGYIGGLVGSAKDPNNTIHSGVMLKNSFANVVFNVGANNATVMAGGVLGTNGLADVENCYARNAGNVSTLTTSNFGSVVNFSENGTVSHCYGIAGFPVYINDPNAKVSNCGSFSATTADKDQLGYMYADNTIAGDTALVVRLNSNVMQMNSAAYDSVYAHWARPGLSELNNDYPVLLMDNYSASKKVEGGGDFCSVGTYAGGPALQYGGPARDGDQLNTALGRTKADASADDYLFIYGDVSGETIDASITANKVALHENAAIIGPGTLANFSETYVGVTFDNSSRNAYSSANINGDLSGNGDPVHLHNDWHMFSTPLSNAPLGFDYLNQNAPVSGNDNFDVVPYNPAGFYNNPWVSTSTEFQWLTDAGQPYYWINNSTNDSYFPSQYGASLGYTQGQGIPTSASDYGHYPYSMDLLTWYEPEYHWINFKRNGPNHWHSDEDKDDNHKHLTYYGDLKTYGSSGANENETTLVTGKGYMGAITENSFMQSHGYLNTDVANGAGVGVNGLSVHVSALSSWHAGQTDNVTGWNLIGNPYHAYLDFDAFATTNSGKLVTKDIGSVNDAAFYVVYSADAYNSGSGAESAYLTYPVGGSVGGAYADRYIHPHQGFFVRVTEDNAHQGDPNYNLTTLNFTESMTVTRNGMDDGWTSTFRGGNKRHDYTLINLFLSSRNGCSEVTVVEFFRDKWGGARKMKNLRNGNGTFYGYHDGKSYSAIFAKYDADRVPIHFKADEEDVFTLRWTHANGVMSDAYLVDNLTGQRYNMAEYDSYEFIGRPADYAARFYIELREPVPEEPQDEDDNFFAYNNGSGWVLEGRGQLQLVDLLGQVLDTHQLNGQPTIVNFDKFAAGVYMLRLVRGDRTLKVQKIVIK